MKILRLLPLMMALVIPSLALTSCDDDDDSDMPDVTISLSYGEGAVAVDHQVYVSRATTLRSRVCTLGQIVPARLLPSDLLHTLSMVLWWGTTR